MKQLLISFLSLVIVLTTPTFGQVDSVTDQYMGNGNLLVNPGLESGLKSWTNVAGVLSVESSVVIKGKRAGKVVLSSQALNLYQDVTSYQAQLADGVQGLASIRVKTSVSGLRVCPRQAGLINSNLCVSVVANNKWGLYKVPFSLGATSNGISINSNGTSVSGTVYFDDSFMGPQELSLETNACQSTDCETNFTASINASDVVSGENLDWIVGDCTDANVGRQTCTFKTGLFTVTPNCVATAGPIGGSYQYANIYSVSSTSVTIEIRRTDSSAPINNQSIISCSKQGADFTAAKQLSNGNTYSSTNADTDWTNLSNVSAGTLITATTTSPTYGTTAVNKAQWKRQGSDLLIKWDYRQTSAGTNGSGVYLFNIPSSTGCVIDTSKTPANSGVVNLASSTDSTVGSFTYADGPNDGYGSVFVHSTSQLKMSFNYAGTTTGRVWFESGANLFGKTAMMASLSARVPCVGWENSNLIIAQLSGLEKCENTLSCTDTFSAKVSSTGVVSTENIDFINGNCTVVTGTYTCNFNSSIFTVAPNCVASPNNTPGVAASGISVIGQTSSAVTVYTYDNVQAARPFSLVCQKQGVDFVSKTAKAVASDQNVRSIGSTGMDIQSVYFGGSADCSVVCSTGNCTICNQVGSKITSISWVAGGTYNINGIDGTKYNCQGTGTNTGVSYLGAFQNRAASTSSFARLQYGSGANAANTGHASVTCIGIP